MWNVVHNLIMCCLIGNSIGHTFKLLNIVAPNKWINIKTNVMRKNTVRKKKTKCKFTQKINISNSIWPPFSLSLYNFHQKSIAHFYTKNHHLFKSFVVFAIKISKRKKKLSLHCTALSIFQITKKKEKLDSAAFRFKFWCLIDAEAQIKFKKKIHKI